MADAPEVKPVLDYASANGLVPAEVRKVRIEAIIYAIGVAASHLVIWWSFRVWPHSSNGLDARKLWLYAIIHYAAFFAVGWLTLGIMWLIRSPLARRSWYVWVLIFITALAALPGLPWGYN